MRTKNAGNNAQPGQGRASINAAAQNPSREVWAAAARRCSLLSTTSGPLVVAAVFCLVFLVMSTADGAQPGKMFNEDQIGLTSLEQIQLHAATTPVGTHRFSSVVRLIRPEQRVKMFSSSRRCSSPQPRSARQSAFCRLGAGELLHAVERGLCSQRLCRSRSRSLSSVETASPAGRRLSYGASGTLDVRCASRYRPRRRVPVAVRFPPHCGRLCRIEFRLFACLKHISLVDVMLVALGSYCAPKPGRALSPSHRAPGSS
jgi:hypothetical protein